jgi:hypothetical protein
MKLKGIGLLSGSDDQSRNEEIRRHVHAEDDGKPVNPGGGICAEPVHQNGRDS